MMCRGFTNLQMSSLPPSQAGHLHACRCPNLQGTGCWSFCELPLMCRGSSVRVLMSSEEHCPDIEMLSDVIKGLPPSPCA